MVDKSCGANILTREREEVAVVAVEGRGWQKNKRDDGKSGIVGGGQKKLDDGAKLSLENWQ